MAIWLLATLVSVGLAAVAAVVGTLRDGSGIAEAHAWSRQHWKMFGSRTKATLEQEPWYAEPDSASGGRLALGWLSLLGRRRQR